MKQQKQQKPNIHFLKDMKEQKPMDKGEKGARETWERERTEGRKGDYNREEGNKAYPYTTILKFSKKPKKTGGGK